MTTLLGRGANVEARNRQEGRRGTWKEASQSGHLKVVRLLLERGADFQARNRKGETPFEMASRKTYSEVAHYLESTLETVHRVIGYVGILVVKALGERYHGIGK